MVSLELLLWDGRIETASKEVNSDLFEACHGAAPELGIILSTEVNLFDISKGALGTLMLQGAQGEESSKLACAFLQAFRQPNFTGLMFLKPQVDGIAHAITRMAFLSEQDDAGQFETLEKIKGSAKLIKGGDVARSPFIDFKNQGLGGPPPPRFRAWWNYSGFADISDETVSIIVERWNKDFPSFAVAPGSFMQLTGGGKPIDRPLMLAKAATKVRFSILPTLAWSNAEDDHKATEWLVKFGAFLKTLPGHVCSHLGFDSSQFESDHHQFLVNLWGEDGLSKVQEVKIKYDPKGVFNRGVGILQNGMTKSQMKIRKFWFQNSTDALSFADLTRWFVNGREMDEEIKVSFSSLVKAAAEGQLGHWKQTPVGCICLVLLLDQFPRHIHRGSGEMFKYDQQALGIVQHAIQNKLDTSLSLIERFFLYTTLTHIEDLNVVAEGCQKIAEVQNLAPEPQKPIFEKGLEVAKSHLEIIKQFSRYPYRNALLGRTNTPEEEKFLDLTNSSFMASVKK
eukprot:TRINITY_DN2663_c0_g1_i1.p1 TRINITY_DN2663_c0_g1~~TRINITY_DN2663_c0_g1_i1.p1  ORF type:complete len:510 (-),score=117.03 TRINITY_DN2663_c0_g1_i1:188-1717(-)